MKRISKDRYVMLYPHYFDSKLSRRSGRRVSKGLATGSPSLDRIRDACEKLGLKTVTESDKAYPRTSNLKSGRIIVFCGSLNKRSVIREVSKIIRGAGVEAQRRR
jgi:signal recognition particle subunit SEC65